MEGHSQQNEDKGTDDFIPFQPASFDKDRTRSASGPSGLSDPALAYEEGIASRAHTPADFEPGATKESSDQPDFGSLQFQRENTLLTNAESYAASIRDEAQLYVNQLRGEVEGLNAEAEERYEEAATLKSEAEAEAARMIVAAQAEVESIRESARNAGFEDGKKEGLSKRYEEAGDSLERLENILKELHQFRKRVAFYTEQDGIRLAMLMAKKILHSELKTNKNAIMRLLAQTLAKMEGKGMFRIWLHPDDHQFALAARPNLERFLDESQSLSFRARADMMPGDILIETDREVIDLTFQSQFFHLDQMLKQTLAEREAIITQSERARPAKPNSQQNPKAQDLAPPPSTGVGNEG